MSILHGVNANRADTSYASTVSTVSGIPIYFGCAPVHTAQGYTGKVLLARSLGEAKAALGYSDAWRDSAGPKWSLCEAMYAHFVLFGASPAIFYNLFDPATHKTSVAAESVAVTDHAAKLPIDVVSVNSVKNGNTPLAKDTDYSVFYDGEYCVIELIKTGEGYSSQSLTVDYDSASVSSVESADVTAALERIVDCKTALGVVPDLICAPGYSDAPTVAGVMAAKAALIGNLYRAKAVCDIPTSVGEIAGLKAYKEENGYDDSNVIPCWLDYRIGDRIFHMSTLACGMMASLDAENGCPSESPSNIEIPGGATGIDGGDSVFVEKILTIDEADIVSVGAGVVSAINFDGWRLWGNYMGCFPGETDVAKKFICTSRMQDFLCNMFINAFFSRVDRKLTRALIDSVVNEYNAWLNGLTTDGHLYGGEVSYVDGNNSTDDLLAGRFRLNARSASPVPAEQINMDAQYDVDILVAALSAAQ